MRPHTDPERLWRLLARLAPSCSFFAIESWREYGFAGRVFEVQIAGRLPARCALTDAALVGAKIPGKLIRHSIARAVVARLREAP